MFVCAFGLCVRGVSVCSCFLGLLCLFGLCCVFGVFLSGCDVLLAFAVWITIRVRPTLSLLIYVILVWYGNFL